jgi:hypothetical protein
MADPAEAGVPAGICALSPAHAVEDIYNFSSSRNSKLYKRLEADWPQFKQTMKEEVTSHEVLKHLEIVLPYADCHKHRQEGNSGTRTTGTQQSVSTPGTLTMEQAIASVLNQSDE